MGGQVGVVAAHGADPRRVEFQGHVHLAGVVGEGVGNHDIGIQAHPIDARLRLVLATHAGIRQGDIQDQPGTMAVLLQAQGGAPQTLHPVLQQPKLQLLGR